MKHVLPILKKYYWLISAGIILGIAVIHMTKLIMFGHLDSANGMATVVGIILILVGMINKYYQMRREELNDE